MDFTRLAIEKSRVTFVALLVIVAAGVSTYIEMPRSEDPGFIIRTALVTTRFPGASPERVEQLVTDRLEKVIQEIPELDFVSSESRSGLSLIYANFKEEYTEMRPIFDDLRRKVERAKGDLPDGIGEPSVNDEFGDVFGVILSIGAEDGEFEYRELKEIADEVRDEILLIDEVAKVEIYGAQEERIFVEYNNARLSDLGLSPIQLRQILEARNIITPGGEIRTEYEEIVLEPSGNFESLEELKRTVVGLPGRSDVLFLEDIAEIRRGYIDPPKTKFRANGVLSLGLGISMRDGGNIIILGEKVRETLHAITSHYPIGIDFDVIQFQPDAVSKLISSFIGNLLQAVALVAVVMLISLGLRTGLVVASLIPMAMISAIYVMGIFDIGLNQMSIAALIIALGMLVDNGIVMSESIMVQISGGKSAVQAAVDSAAELRGPLLTSSLTTAAAFLPIYLAESATGEYTAPLFMVVTITLLCSWILSLTMIPMLSVQFLKNKAKEKSRGFNSRFYVAYRRALLQGLRNRTLFLCVALFTFALALFGFRYIPAIFFPPGERPSFTVDLELPIGTPLSRTETLVDEVETFIRDNMVVSGDRPEGVVNWGSFIGQGAPRFLLPYNPEQARPSYALILANVTEREIVESLIVPLRQFCQERYPDLKVFIRPLPLGPPAWPPVEVRLSGRDTGELFRIVDEVKKRLREIPGTRAIDDDWGARSKKLVVRVDQPRARRSGVTSQDVAISLQSFLSGLEATEFREDDKLIPVTLRSVTAERQDIDKLETLNVYAQVTGQSVPLKQVADVEIAWQPSKIHRRDRLRTVSVESDLEAGVTAAEVNAALTPWLRVQERSWGPGFSWELGGEAETSGTANESIGAKLPVAGLIITLLLVGQFNSLRRPAIILLTIPLSIIGVVFGLLVARSYFGFMTLLGVISLAGVVINNAIVLLDRIRIEIETNGLGPARAVIEASQHRLRPILLTTTTTVFGLIPLWLGGGPMWEPMAIAIIFGLIFATGLTLGLVPVLYSLFFRVDFSRFVYED